MSDHPTTTSTPTTNPTPPVRRATRRDRFGRSFGVGGVIIDRDACGSAGVVTVLDGTGTVNYAPMFDDGRDTDPGHRDHGLANEVELIAWAPPGFNAAADFDFSKESCRRQTLVIHACEALRAHVGGPTALRESWGRPVYHQVEHVNAATDALLDAARHLLLAADYVLADAKAVRP